MNSLDTIPIFKKETETVCWGDQEFPFITFCLIHMGVRDILEFLEIYVRKREKEKREHILAFLLKKFSCLIGYLKGIRFEAWSEAFYASLAMQRYLWEEDEMSMQETKERLTKIRTLLYLDELFKKQENGPEGVESKVSVSPDFQR